MTIVDRSLVFAGREGTDRQSAVFPGICVLPGGRWLCSFRAAPHKQPLAGQKPIIAWSDDEGRSWTDPVAPFTPPAPPAPLPAGRMAMVYVDRTGPAAIKVRVSADHGRSWPEDTELVLEASQGKSQTWDKKSMQCMGRDVPVLDGIAGYGVSAQR